MSNENIEKMIEAADLLNDILRKVIASEKGIHAETIVSAAARMAGTMLFRSFSLPIETLQPGTVVLSDEANKHGPMLLNTMFVTLKQLGHNDLNENSLNGANETTALSQLSLAKTQELLLPWYVQTQNACKLSPRDTAGAGAMATAILIHDCRSVLNVHSGCAIAIYGVVESSKTVPLKFPDSLEQWDVSPSPQPLANKKPWYKLW